MFEYIVILYAAFAEIRTLIQGKYPSTPKELGNSIASRLLLVILSFSYMIFAITWCFDPDIWVKGSGFMLVALSIATFVTKLSKDRLWNRLNAITCLACLATVAVIRLKGLV